MKRIDIKRIDSATLKWIAIITMLIDHIGAGLILYYLKDLNIQIDVLHKTLPWEEFQIEYQKILTLFARWKMVYQVTRSIGRVAFPIFCYMIATGFLKTRNVWKYLLRLSVFCIVSEIPFDLAFSHVIFDWESQNVFFTLTFGLLAIIVIQMIVDKVQLLYLRYPLTLITIVVSVLVAELLHTDYAGCGVLIIIFMYLFYSMPVYRLLSVSAVLLYMIVSGKALWLEAFAVIGLLLTYCYNGEKGKKFPKMFFYLFYPVHLLLIAGICFILYGFVS